jgi:hypothetical protein
MRSEHVAKGQEYSKHQRGIINRYYEHRDSIMLTKLGEIVSELYLADSPKKVDALWKRADKALANLKANDVRVRTVLEERDVKKLAQLVGDLGA